MYCIEKILYFKISVMSPIPLLKTTYYIVDIRYYILHTMCYVLFPIYYILYIFVLYTI